MKTMENSEAQTQSHELSRRITADRGEQSRALNESSGGHFVRHVTSKRGLRMSSRMTTDGREPGQ